jgi:hypothetical protein
MLKIEKKYRKDYTGENIVVDRGYANGVWQDTVEHVHNAVTNNQLSNRAAVIGNGPSRLKFNLTWLKKYSGLLGADTLQTYGCNALYRDFTPDFLLAIGNNGIVQEIADSGYTDNNIVYSNAIHLLEYPNKFYLIPHDSYADAGTTALYLAAFDGHKQIYMLGFDGQDTPGFNYNVYADTNGYDNTHSLVLDDKWVKSAKSIFDTFDDIEFIRVNERGLDRIPDLWKYCTNFKQISFLDFISHSDL